MSSTVMPGGPGRQATDPVARRAANVVGGPRGRFAAPPPAGVHRPIVAGLLGLGSCLALVLGFLQKSYCVRHGWGAPQVYWKACYSDLPGFALRPGLVDGGFPYQTGAAFPEPVGTGLVVWLLGLVLPQDALARQQQMFVAWSILAALLLVVTVVTTVWTCRRHPWWAAHVAFSPLVLTIALVSTDLLAVCLTSVALWCWSRERPTLAGFVLGAAIVTRTYPALLLVVLGVLAVRAGVLRAWARTAGVAIVTCVVALAAVTLPFGMGTFTAYRTWMGASASLGSPWYLASMWDRPIAMGVLTLLAVLGWLLAIGAGTLLTLAAPVRPRIGEVAIVMIVIVLVTGKSLPVQSSLWLVPLVALAGLQWRDHLVWASTEILSFVAVWLYLGGLDNVVAALPKTWYAFFLVVRLLGLSWLAVAATRQAMGRTVAQEYGAHDDYGRPCRVDDAGGPLTDHPDAVVVRFER